MPGTFTLALALALLAAATSARAELPACPAGSNAQGAEPPARPEFYCERPASPPERPLPERDGPYRCWHRAERPAYTGELQRSQAIGRWRGWYLSGQLAFEGDFEPEQTGFLASHAQVRDLGRLYPFFPSLPGASTSTGYSCAQLKRDRALPLPFPLPADSGDRSIPPEPSAALPPGVPTATWRFWHASGKPQAVAEFGAGDLTGSWTAWHGNGAVAARGRFSAGLLDGEVSYFHENGALAGKATFQRGRVPGELREWRDDGSLLRRCEPDADGKHRCTSLRADGSLREIALERDGWPDGEVVHYFHDGAKAWRQIATPSVPSGYEEWHENGQRAARGERGGVLRNRKQQRDGVWRRWHANGRLHEEGAFDHGVPVGRHVRLRDDGKPWETLEYKNGFLHGRQQRFFAAGKLASEWHMSDGQQDGTFMRWYGNGSLAEIGAFANGARTGLWRSFHPNGARSSEESYDAQGRDHGHWKLYDGADRLVSEIHFEHGTRLEPLPPCVYDSDPCGIWPVPAEPLPALPLRPYGAALGCPFDAADLRSATLRDFTAPVALRTRGDDDPAFVGRWCQLWGDGALFRDTERSADGTERWTVWSPDGLLRQRGERIPGKRERISLYEGECDCVNSDTTTDLATGLAESAHWNELGRLSAHGPRRGSANQGLWTFFGEDGRVEYYQEFTDGKEGTRLED